MTKPENILTIATFRGQQLWIFSNPNCVFSNSGTSANMGVAIMTFEIMGDLQIWVFQLWALQL